MSSGGWFKNAPLGVGLILATLFIAMGWMNHVLAFHSPKHQPAAEAKQDQRTEPAKSAEQWAADTCAKAEEQNGDSPEDDHQRKDLCAQFRAAAAAERSAVAAEQQVGIGGWGLGGLFATVIIATGAWWAARSSANADNEALNLTRTQLNEARISADAQSAQMERYISAAQDQARGAWRIARATREIGQVQVRAYLSIGTPCAPPEGNRVFIFSVVNSGLTPARNLQWEYRLTMWESKEKDAAKSLSTDPARVRSLAEIPGGGKPHEMAIPHGEATWLRTALDEASRDRPGSFHIILRYQDVFRRYFELNERIEMSSRSGNELHEMELTHVHSEEREITEAEYNRPIELPEL